MISIKANMIIILLQEKSIYREKLIFSEAENVWYVIMISTEANMILMIKVFRKKSKFIIITHILLIKKNKKWRLTKDSESDFKTDFENVEINYTKYRIL